MRIGDITITGLASDSRKVEPGFLFAALPGVTQDGAAFIASAVANGAAAVLAVPEARDKVPANALFLPHPEPRRALAQIAARFYGPGPDIQVAVTGTNGKTSVVVMTRQLFTLLGHRAASLGTLGLIGPSESTDFGMTSPDTLTFQRALSDLAKARVTHLAFEASSHGLDQHRVDGAQLTAAAFTNLTRDHLDYHGTMEAYFAAKARLFSELLPPGSTAVINIDDPYGKILTTIAWARGVRTITIGEHGADLFLSTRLVTAHGQELTIVHGGKTFVVDLPLIGAFQAHNALAAAGLAMASGARADRVLPLLGNLKGVPGRLELAAITPAGTPVLVDYAHTPDGLRAALDAVRPHAKGRIILVFGCGGNRDTGKRPLMGAIAKKLADVVIITDDNPRSEDPAAIRAAIQAAAPAAANIGDRAEAIRIAITQAENDDVVLIAGKGHEQGQIVGDAVLPFDDRVVAHKIAQGRNP